MSERSSIWIAFALGIGLTWPMLGGCRTPDAPVISSLADPPMPRVPPAPEAKDPERTEEPSREALAENIRRNFERGELEEAAGRPDQAARYYHRILRDDPQHVEAHQRLARIATAARDYRQGERHLRAAIESRPESAELWTELAHCYAGQNRLDDARDALRRASGVTRGQLRVANLADSVPDHRASPRIVRTAEVEALPPINLANGTPSREDAHQPYLSSAVVRRAQDLTEAAPRNIGLASLHAVPELQKTNAEPEPYPDGNLPLWE